MCFSAVTSFSTAIILGITGSVTLKTTTYKSQFFLAIIPLLFAIQQFSEGIVWSYTYKHLHVNILSLIAENLFLTFAFLIWPVWIPFSILMVERIPWRRLILYIDLFCGILLSCFNLFYAIGQQPAVHVVNHSLRYSGEIPSQMLIYSLIILIPLFVSSYKNMILCGALVTSSLLYSLYAYSATFISVWSFFSSVVSLLIYKVLKDNALKQDLRPKEN